MTSFTIELTHDEIDIMIFLANQLKISPSEEPELFCQKAKELSLRMPERIQTVLSDFNRNSLETGYLLIRLPFANYTDVPMTPSSNNEKVGEATILARIQSIFISFTFEMVSYEAEGYGRLFQDIIPILSMSKNQTSLGSSIELEIHTEQAFSKLKPDILSLACLRGDETALTYILPVKTILDNITPENYELLKQPLWKTGVDMSFKLHGNDFIDGDIRGPLSIIEGLDEDPNLIFDQDLMHGINEDSEKMVKKIVDVYYEHRLSHNLKEGEILFIDNKRALHGRSPFYPNYDGYDRFLIRCFAKNIQNYENSSYARVDGKRMVKSIYS